MIIPTVKSYINFKANYNFVDNESFKTMTNKWEEKALALKVEYPSLTDVVKEEPQFGYKISEANSAISKGFMMCNGVGFSNSNQIILNHILLPRSNDDNFIRAINTSLIEDYKRISSFKKPVDILITAGYNSFKESVLLFKNILSTVEGMNADKTILWGLKKFRMMNLFYSGKNDTYWLNIPTLQLNEIKNLHDLAENCFDMVKAGKRANFFIKGRQIF